MLDSLIRLASAVIEHDPARSMHRRALEVAEEHLRPYRYHIVERGWRAAGQVQPADIVALDGDVLVFIAVEYVADAVDLAMAGGPKRVDELMKSATAFVEKHECQWNQIRFDIMKVMFEPSRWVGYDRGVESRAYLVRNSAR